MFRSFHRCAEEGSASGWACDGVYRGRAHETLSSRLEALGIATDFMAGALMSKMIEGGLHHGFGSTLAVSRAALEKVGGLLPLVDCLADDYELGARA